MSHAIASEHRCAAKPGGRLCTSWADEILADVPLCLRHALAIRTALSVAPAVPDAVVYYLGEPTSQTVKIGTTINLRDRVSALRAGHPQLVVLATEPGSFDRERQRHSEFRSLLVSTHSREWFKKAPVLMEHVNALRQRYGILAPGGQLRPYLIAPLSSA